MKRDIIRLFTILLIVLFFDSCKKFVEVPIPKNQLVTSQVFKDSANATSAVLGIYISIMQSRSFTATVGGVTLAGALSSDEFSTTSTNATYLEVLNNSISLTNSFNSGLWKSGYSVLYNINACIEGLSKSTGLASSVKNQLLGECKFMRAFVYFNLLNLYGSIPLALSTDYSSNQVLSRADVSTVYNQILADLTDAKSVLPTTYVSQYRSRPNRWTASAFLAKVYLYLKDWKNAESESSAVLSSGIYSLDPDLNNVFISGSNETIFALQPASTIQTTWEGSSFNTSSATVKPTYVLTTDLLSAFEKDDMRKSKWIHQNVVGGVSFYYPYKYKVRITAPPPVENYVILRLAEQYLIHAEAEAQLNNLSQAISDLNAIRTRAGLIALSPYLTQTQVLDATEQERRVELFAEWGNRWFDLKRWNKANAVLSPIKGNTWQSTDTLFPIPYVEILNDGNLSQNPGY